MIQAFVTDNRIMLNTSGTMFDVAAGCMAIINAVYQEMKKQDENAAETFKKDCQFLIQFSFYTDKQMKEKTKNAKNISKPKTA